MEEEKDLFIKKKLQEDKLISKRADDVFKNFFYEKKEENFMENKNTSKLLKYKKVMAIAACLLVLIGGANVYASTNGYGNIFFLIKYIVTGEKQEVTEKEEILSDRDITISYEKINITENISIQVEKLQIKDSIAKLIVAVSENEPAEQENITPFIYKVYDFNDSEICAQNSKKALGDYNYTDEIEIKNYNQEMTKLKLKVYTPNMEVLKIINIDLVNRTVEVEENSAELQKVSEIELKEFLGKYALLNAYDDNNIKNTSKSEKNQWLDAYKLRIAMNLVYEKEEDSVQYTIPKVNRAIKEFCGENKEGKINIASDVPWVTYYAPDKQYRPNSDEAIASALCINIENLVYKNGYYEVTFTYCYPKNANYLGYGDNINNLAVYQTTMKFKLNSDYEYTKYCLVDVDKISSEKVKEMVEMTESIKNKEKDENNEVTENKNSNIENTGNTTNEDELFIKMPNENIDTNEVNKYIGEWKLIKVIYDKENRELEPSIVLGKGTTMKFKFDYDATYIKVHNDRGQR